MAFAFNPSPSPKIKLQHPRLKPKGKKGRSMVEMLGRNYKTGGFQNIEDKASQEYGSDAAGKKVAGAIFQKMRKR